MTQEQIIDILNNSQKEFKGINEANLDSADTLVAMFEKQKLEFAIEQLKKIKIAVSDKNPFTVYNIGHQIQELEQKLQELEK